MKQSMHLQAFRHAFKLTIPILAGFTFLGIAYGLYMHSLGFPAIYATLMSALIFAGSMEFIAGTLLLGTFSPLSAFILTILVNARHLFYGISMLEQYKNTGLKKLYLIFGLCDETFVINKTAEVPNHIDKGWFMFYVTLLNHGYWVMGATLGGLFANVIQFDTDGISFVMTALFLVIFLDQWMKRSNRYSALIGVIVSILCLLLFGRDTFILPAMIAMLVIFIGFKSKLDTEAGERL